MDTFGSPECEKISQLKVEVQLTAGLQSRGESRMRRSMSVADALKAPRDESAELCL
jgi:hypothetical protein